MENPVVSQTEQKLLDGLEEFTIITWVQTGDVLMPTVLGLSDRTTLQSSALLTPNSVNLWTPTAGGTAQSLGTFKHDDGTSGITSDVSPQQSMSIRLY